MAMIPWDVIKNTLFNSADWRSGDVHEDHQQDADAKINRDQADDPGTFAFLHLEEEQQRHQRQKHHNPVKLRGNIPDQNAELGDETAGS